MKYRIKIIEFNDGEKAYVPQVKIDESDEKWYNIIPFITDVPFLNENPFAQHIELKSENEREKTFSEIDARQLIMNHKKYIDFIEGKKIKNIMYEEVTNE
jgi:hypothetical protein